MKLKTIILSILIFSSGQGQILDITGSENFFLIQIEITKRKLTLFEIINKESREIKSWPVAVPAGRYYPLPLYGELKKIEFKPWWYPTKGTREAYFQKRGEELPVALKPGDPRNAMGEVKFIIQFDNFNFPLRVHGTNDESSIGQAISRGCIRLRNTDILELAQIVQNKKTIFILEE